MRPRRPYRIAVVGAGPSGLYAVAALVKAEEPLSIDVFDRLPTPYGLVRYGVAPDHAKMKTVIGTLQKPFDEPNVEFFGNVTLGPGLDAQKLGQHYHAVIYATGSQQDRNLSITGEHLSVGAVQFVSWYNGHPDASELDFRLDCPQVAIVGGGNVALDLARVLLKDPDEMSRTDVPDRVLDRLRNSAVREVNIFIRRGVADVKFTPAEVAQIGQLKNVDIFLHDADLPSASADIAIDRRVQRNIAHFQEWAERETGDNGRSIHFWFHCHPLEITGASEPDAVHVERRPRGDTEPETSGMRETVPTQLVIRAIGYDAQPLPGLPFDESRGIVPNVDGRIVDADTIVAGHYVAGWIKRGPSGIIGTNKSCANDTVAAVLADLASLATPSSAERSDVLATLAGCGVQPTGWQHWTSLDRREQELGRARGSERVKIPDLVSMLASPS